MGVLALTCRSRAPDGLGYLGDWLWRLIHQARLSGERHERENAFHNREQPVMSTRIRPCVSLMVVSIGLWGCGEQPTPSAPPTTVPPTGPDAIRNLRP
jgi:hypothetical protein